MIFWGAGFQKKTDFRRISDKISKKNVIYFCVFSTRKLFAKVVGVLACLEIYIDFSNTTLCISAEADFLKREKHDF